MYFAKDEIIELNDNRKYLVLDVALLEDNVYYKVQKLNDEETASEGEALFITANNKEGKIYINDNLTTSELEKVTELFKD